MQLGFTTLPAEKPSPTKHSSGDAQESNDDTVMDESPEADDKVMRNLHTLLLETEVVEGKMICGSCGHEYRIKEGIANFLLPSHLGRFVVNSHALIMPLELISLAP